MKTKLKSIKFLVKDDMQCDITFSCRTEFFVVFFYLKAEVLFFLSSAHTYS